MNLEAEIDGWKVTLMPPNGGRKNYHVEASDQVWGKFAECFGPTAIDALEGVALRTGLDRQELIAKFGL